MPPSTRLSWEGSSWAEPTGLPSPSLVWYVLTISSLLPPITCITAFFGSWLVWLSIWLWGDYTQLHAWSVGVQSRLRGVAKIILRKGFLCLINGTLSNIVYHSLALINLFRLVVQTFLGHISMWTKPWFDLLWVVVNTGIKNRSGWRGRETKWHYTPCVHVIRPMPASTMFLIYHQPY